MIGGELFGILALLAILIAIYSFLLRGKLPGNPFSSTRRRAKIEVRSLWGRNLGLLLAVVTVVDGWDELDFTMGQLPPLALTIALLASVAVLGVFEHGVRLVELFGLTIFFVTRWDDPTVFVASLAILVALVVLLSLLRLVGLGS